MSVSVLLAVLLAAVMHAGWNAVVRSSGDRYQSMLVLTISQGIMALALAAVTPLPTGVAWLWLTGSGLLHAAYKLFLAAAYQRGDLSRVYPIARGVAPLLVAVVGAVFLPDTIALREYVGIVLVGLGVMLVAQGVFQSGETRSLIPLALGSAVCTAAYSMFDGLGARSVGNAATYTAWLFIFDATIFSAVTFVFRGKPVFVVTRRAWALGTLAGGMSFVTYWIAVWAMTVAPIALVAAVRETSVLFAVAIGIIWMHEKASAGKILAAGMILAGIITIRF